MRRLYTATLFMATLAVTFGQVGYLCGKDAEQAKPNTLTTEEVKQGWKLLFDGKTLDGWMSWKTRKPLEDGKWTVKDGTLLQAKKGAADVYTADPDRDLARVEVDVQHDFLHGGQREPAAG